MNINNYHVSGFRRNVQAVGKTLCKALSIGGLAFMLVGCGDTDAPPTPELTKLRPLTLLSPLVENKFAVPSGATISATKDNLADCASPKLVAGVVSFTQNNNALCQYSVAHEQSTQQVFTVFGETDAEDVIIEPFGLVADVAQQRLQIDLELELENGVPSGYVLSQVNVVGPGAADIIGSTIDYTIDSAGPVRLVYLLTSTNKEHESLVGTVDITVSDGVNEALVANNFSHRERDYGELISISVASHASSPQGGPLFLVDVKSLTLDVNVSGELDFELSLGAALGTHYVSYVVSDGKGGYASAIVEVNLLCSLADVCIDLFDTGTGKLFTNTPSVPYLDSIGESPSSNVYINKYNTYGPLGTYYQFNLNNARALCNIYNTYGYGLGGRTNWRLATNTELRTLYDTNGNMFAARGWPAFAYWSNTPTGGGGRYWLINLSNRREYQESTSVYGAASCVSEP